MSILVQTISVHKITCTEIIYPFWPTSERAQFSTWLLQCIQFQYIPLRYSLVGVCGWQKNDFDSFLQSNCGFGFSVQFFCTVCRLMYMHFRECFPVYCFITVLFVLVSRATANNDRLLFKRLWCPISTLKQMHDSHVFEIRHKEKYFWLLILSCWKMNCEWDNMKNCPQTAKVGFLKTELKKLTFGYWILRSVQFSF